MKRRTRPLMPIHESTYASTHLNPTTTPITQKHAGTHARKLADVHLQRVQFALSAPLPLALALTLLPAVSRFFHPRGGPQLAGPQSRFQLQDSDS